MSERIVIYVAGLAFAFWIASTVVSHVAAAMDRVSGLIS